MTNITDFTLVELVNKIKKKEISSKEITKAYVDRSKKSEKLNTYVTENFTNALKQADNFEDGACERKWNTFEVVEGGPNPENPRDRARQENAQHASAEKGEALLSIHIRHVANKLQSMIDANENGDQWPPSA